MYEYKAEIIDVYDGDTVTAKVDLGFHISFQNSFRLLGINAPEVRGDEKDNGIKSRDALRSLIMNRKVIIKTEKDKKEKYGRYLATILFDIGDKVISVNDWMVENGYAVYQNY